MWFGPQVLTTSENGPQIDSNRRKHVHNVNNTLTQVKSKTFYSLNFIYIHERMRLVKHDMLQIINIIIIINIGNY